MVQATRNEIQTGISRRKAMRLAAVPIRPLETYWNFLRITLGLYILAAGALAAALAYTARFLGKGLTTGAFYNENFMEEANAIDQVSMIIAIFYILLLLICIVLTCLWTYRAMKNLHVAGAKDVEMSPGWAVGWYFIPFASLWMPFQGMMQNWRGSHDPASASAKVPAFMGLWWALWTLGGIADRINTRIGEYILEQGNVSGYILSLWVSAGLTLTACIAAILFFRILSSITQAQKSLMHGSVANVFE